MTVVTVEHRSGYRLQTGWGHVRVAPFSDDALISIRDVLAVLSAHPDLTATELLERIARHAKLEERAGVAG